MVERSEWPTEQRRAELRERGIVPYSPLSTACVIAGAFFTALGATWLSPSQGMLSRLRLIMEGESVLAQGEECLSLLMRMVVLPVVLAALAGIGWGLFQTRMMFRVAEILPELSRLTPHVGGTHARRWLIGALAVGLAALLSLGLVLVAGPLVAASLVGQASPRGLLEVLERVEHDAWTVIALLAVVAIAAWLASRLSFALRYRMTRQEVQQENRE